jgi:hypothetical protein
MVSPLCITTWCTIIFTLTALSRDFSREDHKKGGLVSHAQAAKETRSSKVQGAFWK